MNAIQEAIEQLNRAIETLGDVDSSVDGYEAAMTRAALVRSRNRLARLIGEAETEEVRLPPGNAFVVWDTPDDWRARRLNDLTGTTGESGLPISAMGDLWRKEQDEASMKLKGEGE